MEYIKVTKVDNVILHKKGFTIHGSLHLTTHHLIFTVKNPKPKELKEIWICYPMIASVDRRRGSALLLNSIDYNEDIDELLQKKLLKSLPKLYDSNNGKELNLFKLTTIKLNCKDFNYISFDFQNSKDSKDVYDSIIKLSCLNDISQLYAFIYQPNSFEKNLNTWGIYDSIKEFKRQGLKFDQIDLNNSSSTNWRISKLNLNYKLCDSYPNILIIPKTISDNVLTHASKYRSKQRIPVLSYYYKQNGCSITRCSQPLVGIQKSRSIQDEKLIDEIFKSSDIKSGKNIIIDARPTTNAMAQTAMGAGSENMDYYNNCEKIYLGIENIHVMRDSLDKLIIVLKKNNDLNNFKINPNELIKTNWLQNISLLLYSCEKLIKSLVLNNSNLLIHCSDGWDRTSQISSLIQLCIDPYYRTIEGFIILVEKDWLSFGHRFNERSGHLNSESVFQDEINSNQNSFHKFGNHFKKKKHLKFTSPIFHQFIETIYQIYLQHSKRFQFNERFLRRLIYHLYSCQYGNFLYDSEFQRVSNNVYTNTRSCWDYFLSRKLEFTNPNYNDKDEFILPNYKNLKWWWQLYGKSDEEMNGKEQEQESFKQTSEFQNQNLNQEEKSQNGIKHDNEDGISLNMEVEDLNFESTSEFDVKENNGDQNNDSIDALQNNDSIDALQNSFFGLSSMEQNSKINLSYDNSSDDNDNHGNDTNELNDNEKSKINLSFQKMSIEQ